MNAFTGIDARWLGAGRHELRAFVVVPVLRLPADAGALAENRLERDRENPDALLAGVFAAAPLPSGATVEAYVLAFRERDAADVPSADRRLVTPGVRVRRAPAVGRADYEGEVMLQAGTSRASAGSATDLAHRAAALHLAVGRRLDLPWSPRPVLEYDFASGDGDPDDLANERFDPLFGARRFDFGPTGLYGALARSNLSAPGVRVELAPRRTVDAFAGYRLAWLASPRDAWTAAGLRDRTGASGAFVGQQLEGRVRWHVFPKNLAVELGGAYLARGAFAREAPGAPGADPLLVYTQLTGTI